MKLNSGDIRMIGQIVGRLHVGQSNLAAIRYVISRLKRKRASFVSLPRGHRRDLMRAVIRHHESNRVLYRAVVTGYDNWRARKVS